MPDEYGVIYTFDIEPEDSLVRGNFASGDDAADKALEDSILKRLDRGDMEAWCLAKVTATFEFMGETFKGTAVLGGCSYDSFNEMRHYLLDSDEYGLKGDAFDDMRRSMETALRRGIVAKTALTETFGER